MTKASWAPAAWRWFLNVSTKRETKILLKFWTLGLLYQTHGLNLACMVHFSTLNFNGIEWSSRPSGKTPTFECIFNFSIVWWRNLAYTKLNAGSQLKTFLYPTVVSKSFRSSRDLTAISRSQILSLKSVTDSLNKQELIRRWDSEREPFNDDIAHT